MLWEEYFFELSNIFHENISWSTVTNKFSNLFCYLMLFVLCHIYRDNAILNRISKASHLFQISKIRRSFVSFLKHFCFVNLLVCLSIFFFFYSFFYFIDCDSLLKGSTDFTLCFFYLCFSVVLICFHNVFWTLKKYIWLLLLSHVHVGTIFNL